jgi:hypothetical protein
MLAISPESLKSATDTAGVVFVCVLFLAIYAGGFFIIFRIQPHLEKLIEHLYRAYIDDSEDVKIYKLLKAITANVATSLPFMDLEIVTQRVKQPGDSKVQWVAALRKKPGELADMGRILTRTVPQESKSAALHTLKYGLSREIKKMEDRHRQHVKYLEKEEQMRKSAWKVERVWEEVEERDEDVVWLEEE